MFGKIAIILYILIQVFISWFTEYLLGKNKRLRSIAKKTRVPRCIMYGILAVIPVLGTFLGKSSFKYTCMAIGNIWLGFFMYYATFILILSLILVLIPKVRKDPEKRAFGYVIFIATTITFILCIYGYIHAQNPKTVTYDIAVEKTTEINENAGEKTGDNLKIVLIADLHLSVNSNTRSVEKWVDLVNSENPDVIVIAGDIFTSNIEGLSNPDKYAEILRSMHAKYGVYAVCGNHDVDEDLFGGFAISPVSEAFRLKEMDEFYEKAGFTMLYDESVEIADGQVTLVGRVDGEKAGDGTKNRMSPDELLKNVDKSKPVVVVEHEPKEFKELSAAGADVVLCGHTHNGQVFPGNLIVPFFNENAYGLKELYGVKTIVTAGTGYYGPPMRIGTDSEVTVVNMSY